MNVETLDWNFPGSLRALAAQIPLKTYPIYSGHITETEALQKQLPWQCGISLGEEPLLLCPLRSALVWGCREGSSHLSKVTGDFLSALLDSAGCMQGYCAPCKSGCSCSHSLPFRQLNRSVCSEKDGSYPFKASWANRPDKYENISLKRTAFILQLTLTNVPSKQLSGKRT